MRLLYGRALALIRAIKTSSRSRRRRAIELAGGEKFLAETLADLAEADKGDAAGIDGSF